MSQALETNPPAGKEETPRRSASADQFLPIHFFTIVLNGQPFIRHHVEAFKNLPGKWHWHIVEGVAELNHDTGWSKATGGKIPAPLHRNGLSVDGTTEYLDALQREFPENLTIYRQPAGKFWDGKREMVNAPLAKIQEACLLWQVDADELWTQSQITQARALFLARPEKTAAYFFCHYFVGPELVITSRDTYGNHSSYEWLRVWRHHPGDRWAAHEPPRLCRGGLDVAAINAFCHADTEAMGLVFQHYAYVLESQLQFKESYYGYPGAVAQWRRLQETKQFPQRLAGHFGWVKDTALVNTLHAAGIKRLAPDQWFGAAAEKSVPAGPLEGAQRILFVRTDSIGDLVLASAMLEPIKKKYPQAKLAVLCQQHVADLLVACPFLDSIICYELAKLGQAAGCAEIVAEITAFNPDVILNSTRSRDRLSDELTLKFGAARHIAIEGDLDNISAADRELNRGRYQLLIPSPAARTTELARHADFLRGLGLEAGGLKPVVWTGPREEALAEAFFEQQKLDPALTMAVFPGAQRDIRVYPGYADALRGLAGFRFLIFGVAAEDSLAQALEQQLPGRTHNLCGRSTLRETAALLRRCRLYVGAESAGAHLACALGVPNVVLLGGGHFGRFMPYSPLTSVVALPLDCFGCDWRCRYQRPHCVKDVSPAVLAEAIKQTLDGASGQPRLFLQSQKSWSQAAGLPRWQSPAAVGSVDTILVESNIPSTLIVGSSKNMHFVSFLLPFIDRGQGPMFFWIMQLQAAKFGPRGVAFIGDERYFETPQAWGQRQAQHSFDHQVVTREDWAAFAKHSLPKSTFVDLERRSSSMLDAFRILLTEDYPPLRQALEAMFADMCQTQKPDAILSWCHIPSVKLAAAKFHIPVIHNELGPLRAPLYRGTVYFDFKGVNGCTSAGEQMLQFARESAGWKDFQPLGLAELRELLIVASEKRTAGQVVPRFKAGAALQVEDDSNLLAFSNGMSNFELIFAARKGLAPEQVLVRQHPNGHAQYSNKLGVLDHSADSIEFLSRCQHLYTTNSSVAFECLLQGRPVTILGDSPAAGLSRSRFEAMPAEIQLLCLNWLFLGYLVPAARLFDADYYRWRLTNPALREIYQRHLAQHRLDCGTRKQGGVDGAKHQTDEAPQASPQSLARKEALIAAPALASKPVPPSDGIPGHPNRTILFVSHDASRTGAPYFLLHLLRWLKANTNASFKILLRNGGPLEPEFRALGETLTPATLGPDRRQLADVGLIYSNTCTNGELVEFLSPQGIPVLTHVHELDGSIAIYGEKNWNAVRRQTTHYFACADAVVEVLTQRRGIAASKISRHYEGVPTAEVRERAQAIPASQIRSDLGLPAEAFLIAACGLADERKGVDLFIQLAQVLRKQFPTRGKVGLVWIGQFPSENHRQALTQELARLGLQDLLFFVGEQQNPFPYLNACQVFALTSREDPFPLVMLEAAALGKPVICFQGCGGAPEFCRLGGGIAVPHLEVAAMARACTELMADASRLEQLGRRAAQLAVARFDLAVVAEAIWRELQPLLAGSEPVISKPAETPANAGAVSAIQKLRSELRFKPLNARLRAELGMALLRMGDSSAALVELSEVCRLEPANTDAAKATALVLIRMNRIGEAALLLEKAVQLQPTDIEALGAHAACLLNLGELAGARAGYQRVLELEPKNGMAEAGLKSLAAVEEKRPLTQPGPECQQPQSNTEPKTSPAAKAPVAASAPAAVEPAAAVSPPAHHGPAQVSIIIPTFNNLALTRQCLESIQAHTPQGVCEIVVVDNGSTDGTPAYLKSEETAGRIRAVFNPQNRGFAQGCNQGAQAAKCPQLVFLNNDTVATANWLTALLATATAPEVGVVGAKLLYANNTIQHAGIGWINGVPDHPHRHAHPLAPEVNTLRELDMVTGACLLTPAALFRQLAGFDEIFRNGVEDVDYCLRARAAGMKVVYEPHSVVYHLEGQSAGRFNHVNENLKTFFGRWAGSFDQQNRYLVPANPKIITASQSILLAETRSSMPAAGSKTSVSWEGSFLDHGSLSHVNRELVSALQQLPGAQIRCVDNSADIAADAATAWPRFASAKSASPAPAAEVTVRHAWPPNWQRPRGGKLVVIQPWEFGLLPEKWVRLARQVDEFWIPSEYVRRVYVESGVPAEKVFVVPNGVDAETFHPQAAPLALATQKKFKFLFVGGTIGRKGPDLLLKAYFKNFTAADDVCLVIKDFGDHGVYTGQTFESQIRAAQARPGAPEILYLNVELPSGQLPGLYTACDCLVLPYRGEGFGLPVLEAMACGLPVMVTAGGATDDFVRDEFAYRIPATRKVFGQEAGGMKLVGDGWLLEPDLAALAETMRHVYRHRAEARERGRLASRHAHQHCSWSSSAAIAAQRIRELVADSGAPVKPGAQITPARLPAVAQVGRLDEARELSGQKNHAAAWAAVAAAVAKRPFHPEAFLLLAEIALAAGDGKSAKRCAQRARDLAPGWSLPKQFLSKRLIGGTKPDWLQTASILPPLSSPRLSICLIVKNEEKFLAQCLKSVRGLAAQVIVVDTGSTDRTVEIAREFGAEIHAFAWCDDFAAARNAALEHATGDWILMLDADEELPAAQHAKLLADMKSAATIAYRLPLVNAGQENEGRSFVPRLYRNSPGVFYAGRIHEQVFASMLEGAKKWGLKTALGAAELRHHGYTKELVQDRNKIERNLKLLRAAIGENPTDLNLVMNLGLELVRSDDLPAGVDKYREAYELMSAQAPGERVPELREVLLTQFTCVLHKVRHHDEVVQVLNSPLAQRGGLTASMHFALGLAHFERKQFGEAVDQMRQCLAKRNQRGLSPINTDILTAGPAHCLALALVALGDLPAAEKAFLAALAETSRAQTAKLDYARFLQNGNRPVEALQQLHGVIAAEPRNLAAWRLGGEIALGRAEFLEFALDWTAEAFKSLPENPVVAAQRAEALMLNSDAQAALPLWEKIWSSEHEPRTLAALMLCETAVGLAAHAPKAGPDEQATSLAFVAWYQKLIAVRARPLLDKTNGRLEPLSRTLPKAAQMLQNALAGAGAPVGA